MVQFSIRVTEPQYRHLQKCCENLGGISLNELIRRILDEWRMEDDRQKN